MVEHDELMRRAVEGLRASRSPAAGAEARVLAALESELGGPPDGFDPGGGGAAAGGGAAVAPVTLGWVAKVVGATAGLAAGGLLLVRVGVGAMQGAAADDQPTRDEVAAIAEVEPADTPASPEQPRSLETEEAAALTVTPGAPPKPRVEKPTEPVESTDALAGELALIGAAKRASTPGASLELLDQHALEYPSGTMASEREALAVVALCQLDRTDEARSRARSLIAKRPGLPLLHQMRDECPALTNLLRQTSP